MDVRALGPVAGLLGGLCWVIRWVGDLAGGAGGWGDSFRWAGIGLLAIALAVVGAALVSRSAVWLRLLVAVAFPLLVGSLYSVVRGGGDAVALEGVIGLLAVVLAAGSLVVSHRVAAPVVHRGGGGARGSHAAR
jgi:hypothetical protein